MTIGEMLFLAMVLAVFTSFGAVLAYYSAVHRRPAPARHLPVRTSGGAPIGAPAGGFASSAGGGAF